MPYFFTSALGVIKHAGLWLTSTLSDQVYQPQENKPRHPDEDNIAVYCIHGTFDRNNSFYMIASRIKEALPSQVKSIHLVSFHGRAQLNGIDFYAQQLKNKIVSNKHKKVILMGHSRGALIANYFTEYLSKEENIQVLTTINICGPLRGTFWAFKPLTLSHSVDQMRSDSSFLLQLTDKMKKSGNAYYYFSASNDSLVSPKESYLEEHKQNVIELDSHGHLSIMWSNRLVTHIKDIIHTTVNKKLSPSDDKPSNVARIRL